MNRFKSFLLCASALGLLSACGGGHSAQRDGSHHASGNRIDAALQRAASQSAHQQSLPFLQTLYARNSSDVNAALNYASALRQAGQADQAALILAGFANTENAPESVLIEYSAIQLALSNYVAAADYASGVLKDDDEHAQAYHYLALAFEALGRHEAAETAFRGALQNWAGDPVPVLNNLALNLATQRKLDESVELISRAAALAPQRADIQSNRLLIQKLASAHEALPPKPARKPA
jgi:Flp pilus assembly protein TadD